MANTAPQIPIITAPLNGASFFANAPSVFSWIFNDVNPYDEESSRYIEYVENVEGAPVQNTGWVSTTPAGQYTFPADIFTVDQSYKWRVKVKDSPWGQISALTWAEIEALTWEEFEALQAVFEANIKESPFTEWYVFTAVLPPSVQIDFPVNDYDEISSLPTYQHTFETTQQKFRYKLYVDDDVLCWDSGVIFGAATSLEQPAGYMDGNRTYKVVVESWDIWGRSATATRYFNLNLNAPPVPIVTVLNTDPEEGKTTIIITNPEPDPGQAPASYNKVYRQNPDLSWELEADNITTPTYTVSVFASGQEVNYMVSAVSDTGDESAKSDFVAVVVLFSSYQIVDPDTGEIFKLQGGISWGKMQLERTREEIWGQDEQYPSVSYGAARFYRGSFQAALTIDTGNPRRQAEYFVDAVTKKPMWFKTPFGDVFKVDISNIKVKPTLPGDPYRTVSFDMVEAGENSLIYPVDNEDFDLPPEVLTTFWIIDPDTGRGMEFEAGPEWESINYERDRIENVSLTGVYPVTDYGSKRAVRSGFSGYLIANNIADIPNALNKARFLLDAENKKPLRFMSPFGDDFLVDIYNFSFELMMNKIGLARRIAFDFVEVNTVDSVL